MKVLAAYGSILVLALATAACSAENVPASTTPRTTTSATMSTPTGEAGPEGFGDYYSQQITWTECGDLECATAKAPLSWQDPEAGEIRLALKRHPATGERQGSLLFNPGGPGASAVDLMDRGVVYLFGNPVQEAFDIVAFDPRGVGLSTPVKCQDDEAKDEQIAADVDSLAEREKLAVEFAQACKANTGPLLGHVDTHSAARDMDMLRAALGDEKLNYLGFSYGTKLGATYAGLFPGKTGRLVLDGAMDTTLSADEIGEQQAIGVENALRSFVAWCQGSEDGCPLTGTVDEGMAQLKTLLESAKDDPLETNSDRVVTESLAVLGVVQGMYSDRLWPDLAMALTEAIEKKTGNGLLALSDQYTSRTKDGSYPYGSDARSAIICLDGRGDVDPTAMQEQAERLKKTAPTVGEYLSYGALGCKNWPYPAVTQEADLHAKGAAPIVVIGTTGDPATPYVWAKALAKTLDSAVLVTYEGEGHTAYWSSNACIGDAVDKYLVDGTVPRDGLTC